MRAHTGKRLLAATSLIALAMAMPGGARQLGLEPYGGRTEFVADLAGRRARAMEALGPDTVLILWAAPSRVYSDDTDYEFRQESNLLYLTGLSRQDITLVLVPGATGRREFLFVPESDPTTELWTGHIPTVEEVQAATGIATVFAQRRTESFDAFLSGLIARTTDGATVADAARRGLEAASTTNRLQMALLGHDPRAGDTQVSESVEAARRIAFVKRIQERFATRAPTFVTATPRLEALRHIKTAYEQRVLRRAVEISAEAHIEGMKATRPGRFEYEVEAAIEYWFLKSGALSWGYPSIVGSGPNATTLHYTESTRRMQAGDLLLVDAAGNFHGLTGDITRTYPVNGRFSPEQRALYELVLAAEEAGIMAARPGSRAADINRAVRRVLGSGLLRLGLVTDRAAETGDSIQIGWWFPHSAVHGIGVDVHDPLGTLDAGAAFVIEPGLYIRPDMLDRLEKDPTHAAAARTIRPFVERYRHLGVRVEDSFLMTATGPENLSVHAPRSIREIERTVGSGRN